VLEALESWVAPPVQLFKVAAQGLAAPAAWVGAVRAHVDF